MSLWVADEARYETMRYQRCGRSGLLLPAISLGLWQNFGESSSLAAQRAICRRAFDLGITHFDLANNYGPPPGAAEQAFGEVLRTDFAPYRDELIISSKAGYIMWPGPYGNWGSRKSLVASCDQSLRRLGLDYVDIFYSHRPDPATPLEETMQALDHIVRSGRALYAGISNYPAGQTRKAAAILQELGTPCLIHQPRYSMVDRWVEHDGLLPVLRDVGMGAIAFSPLAQGLLTNKYLHGIPEDSRMHDNDSLHQHFLSDANMQGIRQLNALAEQRGQTLAQIALAWVLHHPEITSVVMGASRVAQLEDNVQALAKTDFSADELARIDHITTTMSTRY